MTTDEQWQEIVRLQGELLRAKDCIARHGIEKNAEYALGFLAACTIVNGQDEHPGWRTTLSDTKMQLLEKMNENFNE